MNLRSVLAGPFLSAAKPCGETAPAGQAIATYREQTRREPLGRTDPCSHGSLPSAETRSAYAPRSDGASEIALSGHQQPKIAPCRSASAGGSERPRGGHQLHLRLEEVLGSEEASTLMATVLDEHDVFAFEHVEASAAL
jgi:hypothetical protein